MVLPTIAIGEHRPDMTGLFVAVIDHNVFRAVKLTFAAIGYDVSCMHGVLRLVE
jgi:hypothetical protein